MRHLSLIILLALLAMLSAREQGVAREIVPEATADNSALTPVSAPLAKSIAVGDFQKLLVIGTEDGKLLVFPLGNDGAPARAPSQTIELPRPASAKDLPVIPEDLLFHPQLPILYVWQSMGIPGKEVPEAIQKQLPRLAAYRVTGGQLQAVALPTQEGFTGEAWQKAGLALSPKLHRLYLPNALNERTRRVLKQIAWYDLDVQGLPVSVGGKAAVESLGYPLLFAGDTVIPMEGDKVLIGAVSGVISADTEKRQVVYEEFVPGAVRNMNLAKHPQLPVVYFSAPGAGTVFAVEEADGFLTQLPRIVELKDVTALTPPVVLGGRNQLALGVKGKGILILDLTREGWPGDKARIHTMEEIGASPVLGWSERFKRLYVAVQ